MARFNKAGIRTEVQNLVEVIVNTKMDSPFPSIGGCLGYEISRKRDLLIPPAVPHFQSITYRS